MANLRVLFALVKASVRGQMQYRANFIFYSVGNFLAVGVDMVGVWALFARFGNLPGWSLPQIAVLYGMVHLAFGLAEMAGRGFDQFSGVVRTGEFDRFLLRPCPTALLLAGQTFELSRLGRLTAGSLALGWGLWHTGIAVSPLLALVLIGGAVLAGTLLFYGVLVLQATLCFWTVESLEIVNAITYGGITAAQFPLTIYPNWIRLLFTWLVPLAFVNYLPADVLFGHAAGSVWLALLGPVVGAVFLLVSLRVWQFGEHRYHSTGS